MQLSCGFTTHTHINVEVRNKTTWNDEQQTARLFLLEDIVGIKDTGRAQYDSFAAEDQAESRPASKLRKLLFNGFKASVTASTMLSDRTRCAL